MNWEDFRERMAGDLAYPPNYDFDPETLEPKGDLIQREKQLKIACPEMFEGGTAFLDIGCNKGYWCLKLQDKYKVIRGCDQGVAFIRFCEELADAHNIPHALFMAGRFIDLAHVMHTHFDVVYCGGVHHHAYAQQVEREDWVFRHLHAWADVTHKFLIVDGPWDLENPKHNTAGALANEGNWPQEIRDFFTIDAHRTTLGGAFTMRGEPIPSGTGNRKIVVFERITPLRLPEDEETKVIVMP